MPEAVPIGVLLDRASEFYQLVLEHHRRHPTDKDLEHLKDESHGLLTQLHEEYVKVGRAI